MTEINKSEDADKARHAVDTLKSQIRETTRPLICAFIKNFPVYLNEEQWASVGNEVFETDVNPVWAAGLGIACTELALIAFEESGAGFALNGPAFTEAEIRLMSEASGYLAEFSTAYGNALGSLIREVQHRSLSGDPIVSRKLGD